MVVLLAQFVIGIGGQKDIAENDGEDTEGMNTFIIKGTRLTALEADTAEGVGAVRYHAVSKSTEVQGVKGGLILAVGFGCVLKNGHDTIGGCLVMVLDEAVSLGGHGRNTSTLRIGL